MLTLAFSHSALVAQNLKPVTYLDGNQRLQGLITTNSATKNLPAVLILPAWKGIDNESRTTAANLSEMGYVAFIADVYGEGNTPSDNAAASKISAHYKSDFEAYQRRIFLALQALIDSGVAKDKIAIIGYCFGGTGAMEAARAGFAVKAAVSIHGGLAKSSSRPNGIIKPSILVQHPADDKSVSTADLLHLEKELKDGHADFQLITYGQSGHTFTNPESADYNPLMAARAWAHLTLFLQEVLK